MAGPITRASLHRMLCEALLAMPLTYNDQELQQLETDAWRLADNPFGEGAEDVPAHLDHLALVVEFPRGRRGPDAQRGGSDALAEQTGIVYHAHHLRPHGDQQVSDYRRAMDAAELIAHTLEGGWHAGAAVVFIDDDWDPIRLPGEPVLVNRIRFHLQFERTV